MQVGNNIGEVGVSAGSGSSGSPQEAESQKTLLEALLTKRKQLLQALENIDAEVREIQQQLGRRLEELRNCRRPLDEALSHLNSLLKIEGWVATDKEGDPPASQAPTLSEKVVPTQAAYEFLEKLGKPIHYRELSTKLLAYRVPISGEDPAATLLSKLNRDIRFKRYGRGIYGLASWNLRKSSKKRKRSRSKKRLKK